MDKIGFIGVGNMGYPLFLGAINVFGKDRVTFTSATSKKSEWVKEQTGVTCANNNSELAKECKYIVLAVKPQYFNSIYEELVGKITKDHIIISVAAGITIEDIKKGLGLETRVVRSMPNTPALVGEGMTCVSFSEDIYLEAEIQEVKDFFASVGKYEIINENLMNAAVCANGSSPAFVYMFVEALADSVVKYGIPRDKAYSLVAQTVLGAAKMVLETGEHPGKLKDNVCSPGGTTIAGVAALEEHGYRNAIMKAADACYEKATSLKK